MGREQRADVAHDEELTGLRAREQRGDDAAVRARDHQRVGVLSDGELAEQAGERLAELGAEALDAREEAPPGEGRAGLALEDPIDVGVA